MLIIPAIDLINGECVRLKQGNYNQKTVYSQDPVAVAKQFAEAGAELIHIVDLDGARLGEPKNLEIISQVAKSISVPIELGGGIRNLAAVEAAFAAGVERVILGTAVLAQPAWLETAIDTYGERIVIGIDARDGKVAVQGWLEDTTVDALDLIDKIKALGCEEIIYTDISRDGMLNGPNLDALKQLGSKNMKIIASGGVSSLADIQELRALASSGVYAAIVGKAIYDQEIDLHEAILTAQGHKVGEVK